MPIRLSRVQSGVIAVLVLATGIPLLAQQADTARRALTSEDYARAERFMGYNTQSLIFRMTVRPTWLADDRFWYRNSIPGGAEFILVDPARGTRERAFDHDRLAAALSTRSIFQATTPRSSSMRPSDDGAATAQARRAPRPARRPRRAAEVASRAGREAAAQMCRRLMARGPRSCAITTCGCAT
jgi:hypothetical protein